MLRSPQGWQLVVLVLVIIVVFGAARLPDAARSLGKSLKIFRSEVKDLRADESASSGASTSPAANTASTPESTTETGTNQTGTNQSVAAPTPGTAANHTPAAPNPGGDESKPR